MTKGGGVACGAGRHHRAACHLGIVDEDSITEPCHPLAALGKGQLVQSRWQAVAPCFTPLAQGGNMHVVPCLGLELPQWLRSTMGALRSLRSSARTLLPLEHRCQGAIEPPRWWACALRQDSTPRVTARLPSRRPPGPPLRPFPCMGAEGRGAQDPAEVLPHEGVPGLRGGLARGAALTAGEASRIGTAPTAVIMVAGGHGATAARASTRTTAAQATEYRGIRRSVSSGPVPVPMPAGRGRPREATPVEVGARRRPRPAATGQRVPPLGGGHVGLAAALRPLIPAGSLAGVGLPGQQWLPHASLDGGQTPAAGLTRAVGLTPSALGRSSPRQERATAPCGWAPSAPALGPHGPLVRGHGGADESQEVSRRRIASGPLAPRDATAAWGECVAPEPLRPRVPCEAIGRRPQPACQGGHRRRVPASVKTGTLARGAAGAVIALEGRVCHRPRRLARHGGVQAAAVWRHRLRLWRTTGRDTQGESDCHGLPPEAAMAQGGGLRCVPSPMAAGTGRQNPPVVHRHAGL